MEAIPRGHTKAEIKAREKLIKDFFVKWVTEHPEKRVWNKKNHHKSDGWYLFEARNDLMVIKVVVLSAKSS